MVISKNTGLDYLIRDVGRSLMPSVQGYSHEIQLFDKILTDDDFSVRDVVKATLKVMNQTIGDQVMKIDKEEKLQKNNLPIYKAILNRPHTNKRIVLYNADDEEIAISNYQPPTSTISFTFQGVEYKKEGILGSIFYRRLF